MDSIVCKMLGSIHFCYPSLTSINSLTFFLYNYKIGIGPMLSRMRLLRNFKDGLLYFGVRVRVRVRVRLHLFRCFIL